MKIIKVTVFLVALVVVGGVATVIIVSTIVGLARLAFGS